MDLSFPILLAFSSIYAITNAQPVYSPVAASQEQFIKQLYRPSLKFVYMVQEFLKYQWEMVPLLMEAKNEYKTSKQEAKTKKHEIVEEFGRNFHTKIQKALELIGGSNSKGENGNKNAAADVSEKFRQYEPKHVFQSAEERKKLHSGVDGVKSKGYFGRALAEADQLIGKLKAHDDVLADNSGLNNEIREREKGIEERQRQIEAMQMEIDELRRIFYRRTEFIDTMAKARQELEDARNIHKLKEDKNGKLKIYQELTKRRDRNQLKFDTANHSLALIRITGKLLGTFTQQNFELSHNMEANKRDAQLEREAIELLLKEMLKLAAKCNSVAAREEIARGNIRTSCMRTTLENNSPQGRRHSMVQMRVAEWFMETGGMGTDLETLESGVLRRVKRAVWEYDDFIAKQCPTNGLEFAGKMEAEATELMRRYLAEWDEKKAGKNAPSTKA